MSHVATSYVCRKMYVCNSVEEEAAIVIETDQSKLVSYTGSSSEVEEDLHVDVNFDEPIDLAIN